MKHWDDFRIFLAVVRSQRVSAAARALGIDATTVARRLARLGETVGTPLFETIGGTRRLSEAGEALLTQAETIEAAVLSATEQIGVLDASGHVRISLAEGFATYVVAPRVADLASTHPRLRLDLVTASGFLDPSKREADVAVMLARPRSRRLRVEALGDYRLGLYASPAYLEAHGTPAVAHDLRGHVLVGYVLEHLQAPELDYLPDVHPSLHAHLRATSINAQRGLLTGGAGIGVLPRFIAAGDPSLVALLEDEVTLTRTFWLVTHRETSATPRIQAVAAWLKTIAAMLS